MRELRWVLFDLDDTLVDTRGACLRASTAVARELGLPAPTPEEFHRVYGRLGFAECVAAWCGPGHFVEFDRLYLRRVRYAGIGDIGGLLERIRRLRIRTGLVTNSSAAEVNRKLIDAGTSPGRLDFVATPADLPAGKPDQVAFTSVLERHGIDPVEAVYVSDHPADGQGARAAGLHFRGVLTGMWTVADFRAGGTSDQYVFATVHHAVGPLFDCAQSPDSAASC
ncbi:MAG TPA: HAD hydrolase-like protein [Micromonosporaceae bacterium]